MALKKLCNRKTEWEEYISGEGEKPSSVVAQVESKLEGYCQFVPDSEYGERHNRSRNGTVQSYSRLYIGWVRDTKNRAMRILITQNYISERVLLEELVSASATIEYDKGMARKDLDKVRRALEKAGLVKKLKKE